MIEASLEMERDLSLEAIGKMFKALSDLRHEVKIENLPVAETETPRMLVGQPISFWRDSLGLWPRKDKR